MVGPLRLPKKQETSSRLTALRTTLGSLAYAYIFEEGLDYAGCRSGHENLENGSEWCQTNRGDALAGAREEGRYKQCATSGVGKTFPHWQAKNGSILHGN